MGTWPVFKTLVYYSALKQLIIQEEFNANNLFVVLQYIWPEAKNTGHWS
jgi:hypothetical protein